MFAQVLSKGKTVEKDGFSIVLKKWTFGQAQAYSLREWETSAQFEYGEDGRAVGLIKGEDAPGRLALDADKLADGVLSWTLPDEAGGAVPVSPASCRALLVEAADFAAWLMGEVEAFNALPEDKKK